MSTAELIEPRETYSPFSDLIAGTANFMLGETLFLSGSMLKLLLANHHKTISIALHGTTTALSRQLSDNNTLDSYQLMNDEDLRQLLVKTRNLFYYMGQDFKMKQDLNSFMLCDAMCKSLTNSRFLGGSGGGGGPGLPGADGADTAEEKAKLLAEAEQVLDSLQKAQLTVSDDISSDLAAPAAEKAGLETGSDVQSPATQAPEPANDTAMASTSAKGAVPTKRPGAAKAANPLDALSLGRGRASLSAGIKSKVLAEMLLGPAAITAAGLAKAGLEAANADGQPSLKGVVPSIEGEVGADTVETTGPEAGKMQKATTVEVKASAKSIAAKAVPDAVAKGAADALAEDAAVDAGVEAGTPGKIASAKTMILETATETAAIPGDGDALVAEGEPGITVSDTEAGPAETSDAVDGITHEGKILVAEAAKDSGLALGEGEGPAVSEAALAADNPESAIEGAAPEGMAPPVDVPAETADTSDNAPAALLDAPTTEASAENTVDGVAAENTASAPDAATETVVNALEIPVAEASEPGAAAETAETANAKSGETTETSVAERKAPVAETGAEPGTSPAETAPVAENAAPGEGEPAVAENAAPEKTIPEGIKVVKIALSEEPSAAKITAEAATAPTGAEPDAEAPAAAASASIDKPVIIPGKVSPEAGVETVTAPTDVPAALPAVEKSISPAAKGDAGVAPVATVDAVAKADAPEIGRANAAAAAEKASVTTDSVSSQLLTPLAAKIAAPPPAEPARAAAGEPAATAPLPASTERTAPVPRTAVDQAPAAVSTARPEAVLSSISQTADPAPTVSTLRQDAVVSALVRAEATVQAPPVPPVTAPQTPVQVTPPASQTASAPLTTPPPTPPVVSVAETAPQPVSQTVAATTPVPPLAPVASAVPPAPQPANDSAPSQPAPQPPTVTAEISQPVPPPATPIASAPQTTATVEPAASPSSPIPNAPAPAAASSANTVEVQSSPTSQTILPTADTNGMANTATAPVQSAPQQPQAAANQQNIVTDAAPAAQATTQEANNSPVQNQPAPNQPESRSPFEPVNTTNSSVSEPVANPDQLAQAKYESEKKAYDEQIIQYRQDAAEWRKADNEAKANGQPRPEPPARPVEPKTPEEIKQDALKPETELRPTERLLQAKIIKPEDVTVKADGSTQVQISRFGPATAEELEAFKLGCRPSGNCPKNCSCG